MRNIGIIGLVNLLADEVAKKVLANLEEKEKVLSQTNQTLRGAIHKAVDTLCRV